MLIQEKQTPNQEILPDINSYYIIQRSQIKKLLIHIKLFTQAQVFKKNTHELANSADIINTFQMCG